MIEFIRKNFRWIAGGFLLTYFSSFGQTFFISGSVAEWQAKFDLSHGEFGRLYMAATIGSAACLPFVGRLVDIVPEHRLLMMVVPALASATLLAAFAPTVAVLVVAIFMLRLFGQGMMTHIALTATGRWFDAMRGRAVSLVVLGHQGGEATLPLCFAAIAIAFGYQTGWIFSALALLLIGLPLSVWAYAKPRTPMEGESAPAETRRSWTRAEVLRDPIFWALLTGVLAPPFIGTTIFFHQDYLTALREWPPQLFAQGLSLMAITTVVFALIIGSVIDRFGALLVLPFFLLPLSAACLLASGATGALGLFSFMGCLGVSYGVSSTLFGALWPEVYGVKHLGAVRSVIVSAMVLATAAGPGLTGTLIDSGISLPQQLAFMSAYCVGIAMLMALATILLRRRG
ncbi:MFS transporter [Hyphococcus flavus]|uniref:MFS transporter n=1 Tax=Hyphococcus flavus TaxID=1866326 RepID=A0AAE9ZAK7_9PROT|nr:MFS transporter [Hyphococcus flavus]WDI30181.1 MFS transporter [Hyphococcus flavus]